MPCSERRKEIKRRRHRQEKLAHFKRKLESAKTSEKPIIADKIRLLTPGADQILSQWGYSER